MNPLITDILFYVFSSGIIAGTIMVVSFSNPMYALLSLVITFFQAAGLFLVFQAEFLAMLILIVYIGAVSVLFLFVVMFLNVETGNKCITPYQKTAFVVGVMLLIELVIVGYLWQTSKLSSNLSEIVIPKDIPNINAIGTYLYTHYVFAFQTCGIILLVAMIGAIVLTFEKKRKNKFQNVTKQNQRRPQDTLRLTNPEIGKGVDV